ncbi:hypothetical protein KDU71_19880 [Carboxylicivirga sediminis]|uniref:Uncharacterized protein n=1 Tax=Carboxylicivirga sediminis TaxID=2006564 RepID=A0A941F7G7_9BACT|nr:hypothetical protein [Carboxylicivirga sediminis]MBR8537842.1 hypothetical protein [Carboxylicivirga sediminis]
MKSIKKVSFGIMLLAISLIGCERWGGRVDNLDSDRPTDVGPEYGKRGNGGSTDLGTLYGDLLYILRDADGLPVYTDDGFVQPLAFVDGVPLTDDGTLEGVQYVCAVNDEGEVELNFYMDGDEKKAYDGVGPMEVEFGRTSIFRSPQRVMDQAIREALRGLSEADPTTIRLDFCGRLYGVRPDGTEKTVDSPRENMALYQNMMENEGFSGICDICAELNLNQLHDFFYNWQEPWMHVAAGCLAAANDKTGVVTVDKVRYIHSFKNLIGLNPIEDEQNKLYFDFSIYNSYDRNMWRNIELGFLVWNGSYNTEPIEVLSVWDIFESSITGFGYGTQPNFTYHSEHNWFKTTNIGGFAQFADDCNQVLEYVHGDSNIVWVKEQNEE